MTKDEPLVTGWACRVCSRTVEVCVPFSWRCPGEGDGQHHALRLVTRHAPLATQTAGNPFLIHRNRLAWDAYAATLDIDAAGRDQLVADLDAQVAAVAGTGFVATPFTRNHALSDALGFDSVGGVWVKDETRNVAGSHKARHLFPILLHLRTAELHGDAPWADPSERPPLAIASCGNAALAASTLAAAVQWPIKVFVPEAANPAVVSLLDELGATVVRCPRIAGDPPGDPCVLRFREAVAAGAVPFAVQGTENAWCLDGGRTIGWEIAASVAAEGIGLERVFVQVGGGALAASLAAGLADGLGDGVRLHAVQTESCAPLERAWRRAHKFGGAAGAAGHWEDCMWPWEHVGTSAADGILDDETYDWLPVIEAMGATGGSPIVANEEQVRQAHELADVAGIRASATGTSGLAGLLAIRDQIASQERVAVVFSGVQR